MWISACEGFSQLIDTWRLDFCTFFILLEDSIWKALNGTHSKSSAMHLLFNARGNKIPIYPNSLCHPNRHPESGPALSACQAQPKQTCVCGRPISSVAQEDLCALLSAQSWPCPPWGAGEWIMCENDMCFAYQGHFSFPIISVLFFLFKQIKIWPDLSYHLDSEKLNVLSFDPQASR